MKTVKNGGAQLLSQAKQLGMLFNSFFEIIRFADVKELSSYSLLFSYFSMNSSFVIHRPPISGISPVNK